MRWTSVVAIGIVAAAARTAAAQEAAPEAAPAETRETVETAQAVRPRRPARTEAAPVDPWAVEEVRSPAVKARPKGGMVGQEPRFFAGIRTGIGAPPGAHGVTPTGGIELGVAAREGVGLGLHLMGIANPPGIRPLNIPKAEYGFGAAADLRYYIQTVDPLTLYPTLSLGFLAGPAADGGENAVLPVVNPGFGARVRFGQLYTSFEFGLAGFFIPFINMSIGWEGMPQT